MRKLFFAIMTLLIVSCSHYAGPTKTTEETIDCTIGLSADLMSKMDLFLVFGYNTDSTRQVCLCFKMNQFKVGDYSTADSTFDAKSSFAAFSSKTDLKTTNLFNAISGDFNVSINQVGDTVISGTMLAVDKADSTNVPEFTITIPLKHQAQ